MKAVIAERYGPPEVLKLVDVPKPEIGDKDLLIKIHASSLTLGDCEMRSFSLPLWIWLPLRIYMGVFKPRIKTYGQEYAGTVEAVGKEVKNFKAGDKVFGPTSMELGGHAEFIKTRSDQPLVALPDKVSFEEAAAIPTGGLNGLYFIEKLKLKKGDRLLINGAGGSIGTIALQLAGMNGVEVTAVDSSSKLPMLSDLGAREVIDYTMKDPFSGEQQYDVVLEISGKVKASRCLKAVKKGGVFISANPNIGLMFKSLWTSRFGNKRVLTGVADYDQHSLENLAELVNDGKLRIPVDRTYTLSEMQEAHRYVETGVKKGNVIISVRP